MIRIPFNDDWYLAGEGEPQGPLSVPHDAMFYEKRDPDCRNAWNTGYFPGGTYRYTKTFPVPADWHDRHVVLEFEGVYQDCQVLLNGRLAGGHPNGYALFRVEAHSLVEFGSDNRVEVVARNDGPPNSRWYSGSGIHRPVSLLVGGPVHLVPDGVRVHTAALDATDARITVCTTIANTGIAARTATLVHHVYDPGGEWVLEHCETLSLPADGVHTVRHDLGVAQARVWSPGDPALYTCRTRLLAHDQILDSVEVRFGIRIVDLDARNGLRLNGIPIKLRGGCLHHDHGVIGAHGLSAAEDRRVRILKAAGYNAIRSAHHPASRALLDACDRHGMLVMDELSDAWFRPKLAGDYSAHFEQWWRRDLESMVAKDYNHPSVILYSIGNEIAETATARGVELSRRIADTTRELDPTRYVTNCVNGLLNMIAPKDDPVRDARKRHDVDSEPHENLIAVVNFLMSVLMDKLGHLVKLPRADRRTRDVFATVDIAGYNYMHGRYRTDLRRYPERVIVGSETPPPHTARIWREIEHQPRIIGDFTWTAWDYLGEAGIATRVYGASTALYRPYPALVAGTPVIDITGHRQTQSYLNEIIWHRATGPYIAVQPVDQSGRTRSRSGFRTTDSLASWSWEGCEGRTAVVEVYADAAYVELLLDRYSLGSRPIDHEYLARFETEYRPGELTAVAYHADGSELGRTTLISAGPGLRLTLSCDRDRLHADGADLAFLDIALTDDHGTVKPLSDREITVTVDGAATLLGLGSAAPTTEEPFTDPVHSTHHGRALAVLRAGRHPGPITVTVTAEQCRPQHLHLTAQSVTGTTSDFTHS
ncbi:glycoside hydrolase family 2 TIM barrel-domain containing protein [Nocardia sp.]|uniref:glycoside hydrolase family 2 protein n=1 Tax=Nocardia sp. TaxID=1821 RepID=UPI002585EF3E|nr:glycoside hydrolase family 2 TIM barrel-domain containing protein [Nocardia sp.]